MLKKCAMCKVEKVLSEFYKSKEYYGSYCKSCSRTRARDYWIKKGRAEEYKRRRATDSKYRVYMRGLMKARYAKNKAFVDAWKSERGCSVCGEKRAPCLDLHHKELGSKRHALDLLSAKGKYWGPVRTKKALETSEVLCANCHRWLHYQERLAGKDVSRVAAKN